MRELVQTANREQLQKALLAAVDAVQEHGGQERGDPLTVIREALEAADAAASGEGNPAAEELSPVSFDGLNGWDVRSGLRSAVELYEAYGDDEDLLSSSQVETLQRLSEHFATE
ncbi:hypothetical protein [Streptomyces sp. NPDC058268]|uniref:hypothetical protein n=1 Tax=Streptomyces sp. NPDC058268 TaxID=3346413 RepID=UPI0036EE29B9